MITIINPTRLTRQSFFKDLINYLDQHDDVILRQIKAQFPDPVDKLMNILEKITLHPLNLPFWVSWSCWIDQEVLFERTVQFIKN